LSNINFSTSSGEIYIQEFSVQDISIGAVTSYYFELYFHSYLDEGNKIHLFYLYIFQGDLVILVPPEIDISLMEPSSCVFLDGISYDAICEFSGNNITIKNAFPFMTIDNTVKLQLNNVIQYKLNNSFLGQKSS